VSSPRWHASMDELLSITPSKRAYTSPSNVLIYRRPSVCRVVGVCAELVALDGLPELRGSGRLQRSERVRAELSADPVKVEAIGGSGSAERSCTRVAPLRTV
jgi:hypothetical protein